ncbi:MAG: IS66 family insertion sequence element accessory protein TnpB [Chitinophagaceae bacterium]|nr:IS66 family insertion sequence element accessory protein TnpB [Oligoflexus sp.]
MRATSSFSEIYLYRPHVDMRKSINGLSQIVAEELKQNPCEGGLFVFISRDRATLKTLSWDNSGFALWRKRLEKEKFHWLKSTLEDSLAISYEQLDLLLSGLDIEKVKPHEKLSFQVFS